MEISFRINLFGPIKHPDKEMAGKNPEQPKDTHFTQMVPAKTNVTCYIPPINKKAMVHQPSVDGAVKHNIFFTYLVSEHLLLSRAIFCLG